MLLLLFLTTITALNITTYSTPGLYKLTPQDYGYAPELLVEITGGGAGGGVTNYGGPGSAYVKAIIQTNQNTFALTVGRGGPGGVCRGPNCPGGAGTDSSFTGNNIQIITTGATSNTPGVYKVSGVKVIYANNGYPGGFPV